MLITFCTSTPLIYNSKEYVLGSTIPDSSGSLTLTALLESIDFQSNKKGAQGAFFMTLSIR
jgi:hypothetical protein